MRIGFIGGGNMASSIIGGLVASGMSASNIWASDPNADSLAKLKSVAPVNTGSDNLALIAEVNVLILAVKPQIMKLVAQDIAAAVQTHQPLVISIAAGVTSGSLATWLGGKPAIVRCMPNTPALVRSGATGLYANAQVNDAQRKQAATILEAVGLALWVDQEDQLDAVTALSGSGPAYFFLVMEAMQAAGREMGLSDEVANQLTLQTALGAAQMAITSDVDAAELRRRVTSPKGTTERAVNILEDGGLRQLFANALNGARIRAEELAIELEGE
ncbi:MAG: pyrroline-5-carboxylate reductase [Zhongshania marina]|jgi:pyrroline-5-carboxylate reductase|uniref:Pyrroline-5-carboxylate reductase n=1 Tax=Zhongshania marina TaxID=2304603 RepID=A0A2S4HHL5_9GAMM|nr:pyrroline-5-carboxylate reductase [Marortus luteolus]POP53463.1 pyrroline-5-carboxylate reductase [Marortus luteolus]RNL58667.1 pyrroline-5-carboxylate reductase [Zhongshania marina]